MKINRQILFTVAFLAVVSPVAALNALAQVVPPAPSNLHLSGTTTVSSVPLAWNDVTGEDKYNIERKFTTDSNWNTPVFVAQVGTDIITYTDTGVAAGMNYDYRVQACLSGTGCSDYAYLIGIATPGGGDTISPSTPTGLGTTPVSSSQINFSWTASTDNVGVTGYKIFRNSTYITTVTGVSYSDTGLTASVTYSYFVKAVDAAGNESFPSININGTTMSGGSIPTTPSGLSGTVSGTNINLTWMDNSSNETRFEIYRSIVSGTWYYIGQVGTGMTNYTDYGLAAGTYTYQISACNGAAVNTGCSGGSNTTPGLIVASAGGPPTPPTISVPSSSGIPVSVSWSVASGATYYNLYHRTPPGTGGWIYAANGSTTASNLAGTSFTDTSVATSLSYQYKINACNTYGCVESNYGTVSVTGGGSVPSSPALSAPSSSAAPVNLSWTTAAGATYYNLARRTPINTGSWVSVGSNLTVLYYADTGVASGYSYDYTVGACNAYGCSGSNNVTVAVTGGATSSDTQAPTVPAGLNAAPSANSVYLSWNVSTDNVAVTMYKVFRNGSFFANVFAPNIYFIDTAVAAGTTYSYAVTALDAANNQSAQSSSVSAMVPSGGGGGGGDAIAPTVPTGLTITPATSSIYLSWTASTDNVGVTMYKIFRNGTFFANIFSPSHNFTDTAVAVGTTYGYAVTALDAANNQSAQTTPIVYATISSDGGGCPANIASLLGSGCHDMFGGYYFNQMMTQYVPYSGSTISSCSTNFVTGCSGGSGFPPSPSIWILYTSSSTPPSSVVPVNLAWSPASGATYYTVNRRTPINTGTWVSVGGNLAGLSYVDTGVAVGLSYDYTVAACNSSGCSPSNFSTVMVTNTVSSSDVLPPTVPTGLGATPSTGSIYLSWTASTDNVGVTMYKIFRNGTFFAFVPANNPSLSIYFTDFTTVIGTTYSYAVAALDAANNQSAQTTPIVYATISSGPATTSTTPNAPTNLTGYANGSNVYLNWVDNSNNESGFKLYRGPTWTDIGNVGPNITYFTDYGRAAGTYTYHLNAFNSAGGPPVYSPISNDVTITVTTNATTTPTVTPPSVSILADGGHGTVSRAAPASYTLSWTIFGSPTNCTKSGTWGGAAANLSSGSQYFTGVSVLGDKTYTLACSNAGGSSSDTVTVLINNPPPAGSTSTQQAAAGGFLQGSVKDVDDQVVPDVYVHVFSADFSLNFNAITRNDGSFGMSLPAGTYSVEIYSPTARSELIKPAPKSVNIVNGTVQAVALQFGVVSKTISGTATFSTGGPVTDAEVGAYSSNAQQWVSAVTDGAGKFELKVSGGTWQLGIRPKNPGTAQWSAPSQSRQVVFVNNSSFENQTVDFVIAVQGAQVNVRVVDQNGIAIQNAGIVVDTMSASQQPSGMNSTPTIFKKSDSGGTASFSVQGGTYYLRAFLPPESGYSNPDEQPIFLNAKETKDVSLVFRKRANLSAITINGLTRFDDGTPTDAFVWAWSEKGDATQIRSEADGNWKIQVAAGRWHIGAGKERSGIPYKSSELTVDVVSGAPTVEVVLSKMGSALPPPVTVSQEANQQIIAQAKDGAKVEIPGGAAASSGNVNVQMKPTIEAASQAGAKVVSIVYDVSITNAGGTAITSLEKEIEITIPYSDADLEAQGVTTGKLVPSYYDATTGNWVKVDNFTIDKVHHVVVVRVKHLTRFALVAAADITPPEAPTVATAKSSGNGEIAVSWVSPKGDFDHVKIYRSTTAGTLGKIVSNNISANSAKDADVVDGTKYFYTVRAVDAAGNESVNVAQVSVFAKGTSAGGGKLSRNLKMGSQGDDVATLQKLLIKEGVYPGGTVSGYFGKLTAAAVARLQEKYADEILKPNGLDRGTGIVGTSTRMKLNKLLQ